MLLNRFHRLLSQWIYGGARMLFGKNYDLIPKGQYDYIPKGKCVFGPADRFLLIPKNRYRAKLLPDQVISRDLGIGWITEDNSSESYDKLWGDDENLQAFRSEAENVRDKLAVEILDFVENNIPTTADVVDIGCGVGDLLLEVRKRKPQVKVYGLDFSSKALDGALLALPGGDFIQYSIEKKLPYKDNSFDVVFCTDVIEHLEYPKLVTEELLRICRPGGLAVVVVPDGDVDQFLGHYWFWSESSFKEFLSTWDAKVLKLTETGELIACIRKDERGETF